MKPIHGPVLAYLAVVLASLSLGAILPMIPVLGRNMGASYIELGYIGTATYLPYIAVTLVYARVSDRFNRLRIFTLAMFSNGITLTFLSTANSVTSLIAIIALQGMSQGLYWASSEAFILSGSSQNGLVAASRYVFLTSVGFFLGPALGGFVTDILGFVALFILSAALYFTGGITLFLHSMRMPENIRVESSLAKEDSRISGQVLLRALVLIVSSYMVLSVTVSILPGYLRTLGASSVQIGTVYTIFFAARLLGSLSSASLSRLGERRVLLMASGLMTAGFFGISSFEETLVLTVLMFLLGFGLGTFVPIAMHSIAKVFPDGRIGAAMGIFETTYGATSAITPFIAGLLAETVTPTAPYLLIGLASFAIIAFAVSSKRQVSATG
ncbi:MAG: MFS transporter [Thaumarchaeota archaeon]|nr:MFS transporter [Nitrososphaerota archaeon]